MDNSLAATAEHPLQVVANKLKIGKAERRFAEGKWWLVAPLTTIIPDGILNGSKGPGFYPTTETKASVKAWDGMPLTAYHPMDESGRHTSAGAPGVLDRQGIGIVRDSAWNGKLQHKGWFDEERVKKVNPLIYHNLIHRIPIETSTGLYTDNVEAPKGSSHNGRPYTWTARNYRPDHIAVLPDQVGACSIGDGCGVLVNAQGLVVNQAVTVAQWVENACECHGACGKCKPSLNSLASVQLKGERSAAKRPGVEDLLGSLGHLRTRPSLLQVLTNYDPSEARGEGGKWAYTGAAGDRGKTLHKHSQAAHDAVTNLSEDKDVGAYAGKSLQERSWWDKLLGHYDAKANSEKALKESSVGNHALAAKYHLAVGTQLSQAANEVGEASLLHKATHGWLGSGGDKKGEAKLREAASKHMYAGGEAGGGEGFGDANKLTDEAHKAADVANKHKVAWLHHAAVNAHLKASQAWRDEADKQGDEGLKKVLGSIAAEHQNQAWKHGKSASEAEVDKSTKMAPKSGEKKYEFLKPSTNQLGLKPSLLEVENFNPFHDIKGKFAAAGGAIGGGIGAGVGRTYGTLKEKTWGRNVPIAYGASYAARGRNRGRDIGEAVGGTVGGAVEKSATLAGGAAGTVAGLASKGWNTAKPALSALGKGTLGATLETGKYAGKAVGKTALWAGKKALVVPAAVVGISSATLLHGLSGGAEEVKKVSTQFSGYVRDLPKPTVDFLTKKLSSASEKVSQAYARLTGVRPSYSPSVSPANPSRAQVFGAGAWGKDYQGAIGSKTATSIHAFSLSAQNAATSPGLNFDVIGKSGRAGSDLTQEAYREAQLGNHGVAAEKHVKAADLLQKTADDLKSWRLQALQRPDKDGKTAPIPSSVTKKLSDRDKQALKLEDVARKNRLAAIMQGNNPLTQEARQTSIHALAAARSAIKEDTAHKHTRAARVNVTAKEAWEKMVGSEHNPHYKKTYEELAKHHAELAKSHNETALERIS